MKRFSTAINGFNKNEVVSFVTEVTSEYEKMLQKVKDKDEEITNLKEKLVYYQNLEGTLNKAILVADEASNQIKRMARDESKNIVDEARNNASKIVNNALLKADKTNYEVEELKRKVYLFKKKFKQVVEDQLEMMDDIDESSLK